MREIKKYSEFKESTKPQQLELFSLNDIFETKRDKYSTTVDLYDITPKYYHGDLEKIRKDGKYLDILKRDFVFKKQNMTLKISPALIEQKDGSTKAFYPSQREEIIEDVLRKFATNPNRNEFLDNRLTVRFTLYELWKELKKVRHPYKYGEIIESLEILSKTNIEIKTSSSNNVKFSSNMFETFGVVDNNEFNINDLDKIIDEEKQSEYGKKVFYFVRFNSLVSDGVKNKSWRVLNYEQCMSYKKFVSRWLHKRISNMFLTKKIELPYNILLSTIIRDSGMTMYESIRLNLAQVQKCLAEMISVGSIDRYEMEKIFSKDKSNRIEDVKFYIYVSHSFFDDLKLNGIVLNEDIIVLDNSKEIENNLITNNIKQQESEDVLKLKKEIEEILKPYNISNKDINKIFSYKNISLDDIKNNILLSIDYINKELDNNKKCNVMAIITSSIKNDWYNNRSLFNNEKPTKSEKEIILPENKEYKKIVKSFIEYFGEQIYSSWLSNLNFESIQDNKLILSCNNKFIIDTIKKDYFNGIQKKDENGNKIWYKKGIKQLASDVFDNIKDVEIVYIKK